MKKVLFLFIFLVTPLLFGQKKYKVDYTYIDVNKTFIESSLFTDGSESLYQLYDKRDRGIKDLPNGEISFVENDNLSRFCYTNNEKAYYRFLSYGNEFIYFDKYNEKTNWEINNDIKKKINNYECVQAKLSMNGRRYTAWFTYEIPIKFGPMKLHNLPGLILEVKEDGGFFEIKFKSIQKVENVKELYDVKKYVLNKKVMYSYQDYEKRIIEIEVNNKIRWISEVKKMDAEDETTTSINDDLSNKEVLDNLLDCPKNLITELKKYQYN